jgi:hypothetical protein
MGPRKKRVCLIIIDIFNDAGETMKITTNRLRHIIREELSRVLEQGDPLDASAPGSAPIIRPPRFPSPIETAKSFAKNAALDKSVRKNWEWWAKDRGSSPSGKVHADVVIKNMRIVSFTVNEDQSSAYKSQTKSLLNSMKGESGKPPAINRGVPDGTYEVRLAFGIG